MVLKVLRVVVRESKEKRVEAIAGTCRRSSKAYEGSLNAAKGIRRRIFFRSLGKFFRATSAGRFTVISTFHERWPGRPPRVVSSSNVARRCQVRERIDLMKWTARER